MRDDRARATPSLDQAAGAVRWLRARLDAELRCAGDDRRRVEVESLMAILDLHPPEETNAGEQRVWHVRAKCGGESWRCYTDGENVVGSPCQHVKLIARPYAGHPNFPKALRMEGGPQ